MKFIESQLTFQRDVSPPSSGLNNKPSKKPTPRKQSLLPASCWFLGLFDAEDGGNKVLQNIS
jgi:hypothetical protein